MHGDVTVTLSGFVATSPTLFRSESGNDFASFRIAQTRRYLDRERGEWVDGRTLWFTVKAWKSAARNVATSLHKGDPVVVTGRLALDEWTGQDGAPRTSLVVEAGALGHDLSLGESRFARTVHRRGPAGAESTDAGVTDDAAGTEGSSEPTRESSAEGDDADPYADPWSLGAPATGPSTGTDAEGQDDDADADDRPLVGV
nr:single-stranded DNA-binding protein [Cellulosimicrobium arenosum]